jgi:hypothetical protein
VSGVAGAWAVIDAKGEIVVRTISDTRRAAIINWLCVEAGVLATQFAFDAQIEMMWEKLRGKAVAELVTVSRPPTTGGEHG